MYYVNDEVITSVRNSLETNAGLTSTATVAGSKDFANNLTRCRFRCLRFRGRAWIIML